MKPARLKWKLVIPSFITTTLFVSTLCLAAYFLYSTSVREESNTQMEATSNQVVRNYENYFSSTIEVSAAIGEKYNRVSSLDELSVYLSSAMSLKSEALAISLYNIDGRCIAKAGQGFYPEDASREEFFVKAKENPLINVFSSIKEDSRPGVDYSFTLSRYVQYDRDPAYDTIICIDFDFNKIANSIPDATLGEEGRFSIYDSSMDLVYSSLPALSEAERPYVEELVFGTRTVHLNGHDFYLYVSTIQHTTWSVAILTNSDYVLESIGTFSLYLVLSGLLVVAIAFIFFAVLSQKISRPITKLSDTMLSMNELQKNVPLLPDGGILEVGELNGSFNALMQRINELTENLLREKEMQRKSELKALQNQINPHFLYNTLDSILSLIEKGENGLAEQMVVGLSRFFRLSISKGRDAIYLKEEFEHARNYLLVQKIRFQDAFEYSLEMEDGLEDLLVPKLILQPIVENSINHALTEDRVGHIDVTAKRDGERVLITIRDDGFGMTEETLQNLRLGLEEEGKAKGVGLPNVYGRLKYYFGEGVAIQIDSVEEEGTTVTLIFPFRKERP